ncbi:MAG TPA: tetratricopeptide repeat protein [Chitinophagaceae bacterium]|nr:tetratricopeptide repeat protein [Chitinophagaceae bacterium]
MKKITFSLIAVAVSAGSLLAQSVDQGKKFLYYQRYKSAQDQFEKVLAANPNDIAAVYWLGQTFLENKNQQGAKDLYQKALATNGAAPLILAGVGQIELLEGKTNDARQRFETAISLSKGKDIDVLNAIGQANADVDTKSGDPNYAIEKLNLATQIKNFKNPATYSIMGDAHRKLVDGGAAVTAYQKALGLDPKYAEAEYKIGKIYQTQNNKEQFLPAYEKAIEMDPNYAPAYYELYYYYYFHADVTKSITYFDKYLTVTDPKPTDEYDKIANLYAAKNYADAITKSQAKISTEGANADPRYYRLLAYSYNDKGDSVNAKKSLDDFFAKQKPEGFVPMDYSFRAQLLSKFPGNEAEAFKSFEKAVEMDTVMQDKMTLMASAADLAKKMGNRAEEAKWRGKIFYTDPKANKTDLYNYGFAYYQAGMYDSSMAVFGKYKQQYPDEIFGYLWGAKSAAALDTTMAEGKAIPDYIKLVEIAKKTDSVKYKSQILGALFYLASYSNDVKKDKEAAINYLTQVTYIDPTNTDAPKFIEMLRKPPARQPAPRQPAAKPKTGAGGKAA